MDGTGAAVVQYTYDAWGKLLTTTGSMKWTLGVQNPLCYRGYVYDQELGLYYLQSRYYDPELCRFLNADDLISSNQGPLGCNMFSYCLNNPVNFLDYNGMAALPIPTIVDYFHMHRQVQYDIVEQYGFAMEVRIGSLNGMGRLDLYDATTNQYYEVKSIGQVFLSDTTKQMEKYDSSNILDWRFLGYIFLSSPQRGQQMISGTCTYLYWDIYYRSDGNGMIIYSHVPNKKRYAEFLGALVLVASAVALGYAGKYQGGGLGFDRICFYDN